MLKSISFFLCCFMVFLSFGQSTDYVFGAKISPDKLKTDFSILLSSLRENHPALYEYTSKSSFDLLAEDCLSLLTDSLTEGEFHVFIRKFTQVMGCGHTVAHPSLNWYKAIIEGGTLIPLHIFIQGDQLYVRNVLDEKNDSLIGARLISVDGVSASEILFSMKSIVGSDGEEEIMVSRNIERLFQTYYVFLYGMKETYIVESELASGKQVWTVLNGGAAKKYPKQPSVQLTEVVEIPQAKFGILDESKKNAVLELKSFSSKGYKKFYRKVFKRLSKMDSVRLVLDLRGNGGGYFPNGNQLLRYLMNENFTMDFSRSQKRTKKNQYLKLNYSSKVTRFVFGTIRDANKEDSARNYQIRYKSIRRNHFDGEVYVLTDGLTFSTGSFVTSKLKNSRRAIVVGEETGGGEVGFNAVLSWRLELPASRVRINIPMYHVDVQPEMNDVGKGVVPDIQIQYNLEQRMEQIDLEMVQILKLL